MRRFVTLFVSLTTFYSTLALAEGVDLVSCDVYLKKQDVHSTVTLENSHPQFVKVDGAKTLELSYGEDSIRLKLTRPPTKAELKAFKEKMGPNEVGLGPINIASAGTSFGGPLVGATLNSEYVYVNCNMETK
ncbi:MAG TPA: hypothetical protein VIG33_17240 [Pseudobdellovibrionaceae bacterium]|jgi:hypothetical protein